MNENSIEVLKYIIIHFLIFLFKNVLYKILLKLSIPSYDQEKDKENEIEQKRQKMEKLKDEIREISASSNYVKFTKLKRQIDSLNDEINEIINSQKKKDFENNLKVFEKMNLCQKIVNSILNSYFFKFSLFFANVIEYILLKDKYLEVDYESRKNNIVVNYFYDENDNKYYSLIPVYKILVSETIVLNSISNIFNKLL